MSLTNFIACWVYLLRDRIHLKNDINVELVKEYKQHDRTPCIYLDDSPSGTVERTYITHDPKEHFVRDINQTINIHVYADNEKQRRNIVNKVDEIYKKAMTNYYKLCLNFTMVEGTPEKHGYCKALDETCLVESYPNHSRSVKGKCPEPENVGYRSVFDAFGLRKYTFEVLPSFDVDDLDISPPVYHSVIQSSCTYIDDYCVGGKIAEKILNDTKITKKNMNIIEEE